MTAKLFGQLAGLSASGYQFDHLRALLRPIGGLAWGCGCDSSGLLLDLTIRCPSNRVNSSLILVGVKDNVGIHSVTLDKDVGTFYGGVRVESIQTDNYKSSLRNKLVAEAFYLTDLLPISRSFHFSKKAINPENDGH